MVDRRIAAPRTAGWSEQWGGAVGDQMRFDQSIGRKAANRKTERQEPEIARVRSLEQRRCGH